MSVLMSGRDSYYLEMKELGDGVKSCPERLFPVSSSADTTHLRKLLGMLPREHVRSDMAASREGGTPDILPGRSCLHSLPVWSGRPR